METTITNTGSIQHSRDDILLEEVGPKNLGLQLTKEGRRDW